MIENLTICHIKKSPTQAEPVLSLDEWSLFETCQRKVYISMMPEIYISKAPTKSIIKGEEAYLALLNILCGLESRVVGETEVFGQFKIFVNGQSMRVPSWFNQFRRVAQDLIVDVKEIRNSYLADVGLRSYGSLTKSSVSNCKQLAIIGGGQLAKKALPYLNDGNHQISMFLRSPSKAKQIPARLSKYLEIYALDEQIALKSIEGLIIAAPLSSKQIEGWLKKTNIKPNIIVDLRDQSADKALDVDCRLVTLNDLFAEIEKTSALFQVQIAGAKKHIIALSRKRFFSCHFRPFGWEDICA
ncbi:MAG: hypothetical protein L3J15_00565 [Devosiaceae bacterium]|nr:hypothetical protein [Devosiaceae bacterium]